MSWFGDLGAGLFYKAMARSSGKLSEGERIRREKAAPAPPTAAQVDFERKKQALIKQVEEDERRAKKRE